uniref:Uncharacterized protein n=1 Tax=Knipowitschia caucasica TaxID=637954 RepID=A0AAV2IV58_KNICA
MPHKICHIRFCRVPLSTSHFFIILRSIDSSASSSAHTAAGPWRFGNSVLMVLESAPSAIGGVLHVVTREEKVRAADRGGKNGSLHLPFLPEPGSDLRRHDGGGTAVFDEWDPPD